MMHLNKQNRPIRPQLLGLMKLEQQIGKSESSLVYSRSDVALLDLWGWSAPYHRLEGFPWIT